MRNKKDKSSFNFYVVSFARRYRYFLFIAFVIFCLVLLLPSPGTPLTAPKNSDAVKSLLDNIKPLEEKSDSNAAQADARRRKNNVEEVKENPAVVKKVAPEPENKPKLGKDLDSNLATIFLGMPSLGDTACNETIASAYKQAKNPNRIFFGLYQQSGPSDVNTECIDFDCQGPNPPLACQHLDQIVINRTTLAGAMGPVFARHMADSLYKEDRDYVMILDSHTVFREEWDNFLIDLWKSTSNEYAIVTHYPWGAEHLEKRVKCFKNSQCNDRWSYHVCGSYFEGVNHMMRNANGCHIKNVIKPVLTPFFAAGFAFARSHLRDNVPWDPYQKYVFWGEEFSFGSRAWTYGYDFYSPHEDIVGHWYGGGPKRRSPFVSHPNSHKIRDGGEKRIMKLWGILPPEWEDKADKRELDKYGLGTKRRLDEFWKFAGIDPQKKTITVFPNERWQKGGLEYVPYNEA